MEPKLEEATPFFLRLLISRIEVTSGKKKYCLFELQIIVNGAEWKPRENRHKLNWEERIFDDFLPELQ